MSDRIVMADRSESQSGTRQAPACDRCRSRRQFIGESVAFAAAFAAALGVAPERAFAWSISETSGGRSGNELSYPIPAADGVTIDRDNQVILVRNQGDVYAFNQACPHENTALKWRKNDGRFQCPRHESKYRPDGTFIEGRATRNMDRFAVRRDGDKVVVNVDVLYRSDENATEWAAALLKVA
jgi:nitrite reductase/ring-hydroxylating ferredoxin subunit